MRYKQSLLVVFFTIFFAGCSTIHFTNGPEMEETVVREKWHHSAINGLIEVSRPFDLGYACDNKQWDTVTVEKTFLNSLATFSSTYFSIYSPWAIYYECRESID